MSNLKIVSDNKIAVFDPATAKEMQAKGEAVIGYAKEVQDWPTLIEAIDKLVEHQGKIVAWWKTNVGPHGGDRKSDQVSRSAYLKVHQAEKILGFKQPTISRWNTSLTDDETYKSCLFHDCYDAAMGDKIPADSQLIQQSLSNEHYTPAKYIEAARAVMGEIDLDPASCKQANKIVKAKKIFEDAGETKPWKGRVWLNPPYGRLAGLFVEKLAGEVDAMNVTEAIVLVNAHCTDTAWFKPLWDGVLCFTDHRINFYGDDDRSGSTHGSVFAYFGDQQNLFANNFRKFGAVVRRL